VYEQIRAKEGFGFNNGSLNSNSNLIRRIRKHIEERRMGF
jgi:hypothetical protein